MRCKVGQRRMCLGEIRSLTLAQLARVLNRLLEPRYLCADLVVACLHCRNVIALLGVEGALLLDRRFGGSLISERGLHRHLTLTHGAVVHLSAAVQIAQLQREQLGREAPLLLLETLIATCGGSLSLQVSDLLLYLIAQILQALEVLARLAD